MYDLDNTTPSLGDDDFLGQIECTLGEVMDGVCVCMCVCVLCVCMCVCVCVCVLDGEESRVVASIALVVVWTAMYLTSYNDYLVCVNHFCRLIDVTPVQKMSSTMTGFPT